MSYNSMDHHAKTTSPPPLINPLPLFPMAGTQVTKQRAYLFYVLLLFLLQSQFYKDLLKLLIAVVNDELFKAVLLHSTINTA